jgi:hypothetical protein
MNKLTRRNAAQWKRVAHFYLSLFACVDALPHSQAFRPKDVAPFAVRILHERQPRVAIGIILNRQHRCFNARLIAPVEIDDPVHPLVAAAAETACDVAVHVAAGDGAFGFYALELETAARLKSGVVFVICAKSEIIW